MEQFDLYDKQGNLLGKKMNRGSTNGEGEYHLVVHIWIKNSNNQYLIQQRNKDTDRIPFQWACTGGAVVSGEDSLTGAQRETEEELGITLEKEKLIFLERFYTETDFTNYMTDLYVIKEDLNIRDCNPNEREVKKLKYVTLEEYKKMCHNKEAWDYERFVSRIGYYEALEKS